MFCRDRIGLRLATVRRSSARSQSEVFGDQLEIPHERTPLCTRGVEAVAEVIVNQRLLGILDGAFDGLQLLSNLSAGPLLLDHLDDGLKMAVGAFQALGDGCM